MKTFMCKLLCLLMLSVGNFAVSARTVLSESTGEPIIYASVGVVNRNYGTVTDTLGNFTLTIPAEFVNDSVRISSVGYKAQTFAVKDINSLPDTIFLSDDFIMLSEVVVKPQKIKHKVAGRRGGGGFIYINVEGYKAAGQGLAIPLSVKKHAWLKQIGFTVVTDNKPLTHMTFRVNVYRKDGSNYVQQNIAPIYFDYDISQLVDGAFAYKFPEEITLDEGDYYVELEFLENFTNEYFLMKTKPLTGQTRYRYASQSEWETLPFGAPIYVEYDNVE